MSKAVADTQSDETIQGEGGIRVGRTYLPCTFTGGQRYMKVKYLEAIALSLRLVGPTYFLTISASGTWEAIRMSRYHHLSNEPLLCSRAFHIVLSV